MVRLDFAGSPESNPYDDTTEDAFYYIDPQENTRFEPHSARLGSTASVGCFNVEQQFGESTAVVDAIKFIDKEGFVAPGNPPAYNNTHEYSVVVDLGQPVRRISIAHADCGFWDNSGNYTAGVSPVESVPNAAQSTSIEKAFQIKGIGLVDRFSDDPAASVDTDSDGVGDNGDAFHSNAGGSADTDGDGIGNNADNDDDDDGVLDTEDELPWDASESIDTDGDGVGNNADTDDDGDGFSDAEEIAEGTDPLDGDSYPEVGGLNLLLIRAVMDAGGEQ